MAADEVEDLVLGTIDGEGGIEDTVAFAQTHQIDHKRIAGLALSLHSLDYIKKEVGLWAHLY